MSLAFYTDVHVPAAIVRGLRLRGVNVLTAQEDDAAKETDEVLLGRASELGRVLFTQDEDLLVLAAIRQRSGQAFSGIIYTHQLAATIGQSIDDLELLAKALSAEECQNTVIYLPL